MKQKVFFIALILLVLCALLLVGRPILAQTSTNYNLEWHVIGGGGEPINSSSYAINSTIGQPAASQPYSISANYSVSGGFWLPSFYQSFVPLIQK